MYSSTRHLSRLQVKGSHDAYFTVGDAANFEEKLDDLQDRLGVRRDSYVPVFYHYESGMRYY
jgi:hypothetical protein